MEFDRYTITLLILSPDAPQLPDETLDALQDAHMSHILDFVHRGLFDRHVERDSLLLRKEIAHLLLAGLFPVISDRQLLNVGQGGRGIIHDFDAALQSDVAVAVVNAYRGSRIAPQISILHPAPPRVHHDRCHPAARTRRLTGGASNPR